MSEQLRQGKTMAEAHASWDDLDDAEVGRLEEEGRQATEAAHAGAEHPFGPTKKSLARQERLTQKAAMREAVDDASSDEVAKL